MMKKLLRSSLLICLAILVTACAKGSPASSATGEVTTSQQQPGATDVSSQESDGMGDFNLPLAGVSLDSLHSYRQILQTSFEGTINSQPQQAQTKITREFDDKTATYLSWIETDDQGAQFFGTIGNVQYIQPDPEAGCFASPLVEIGNPSGSAYDLASLPPVVGAVYAGDEEMNGIPARHYTFDAQAIGLSSPARAEGEVWVAVDGGYVLRYTLTVDAADNQLGPGVSGVQTWTYNLSEINAGSASLPVGCQQLLASESVPRLEEAVVIVDQPGYLVYQAAKSADAAVAFYLDQAETLGWAAGIPVQFGSVTRLTLRPPDGKLLQLSFEPGDAQVQVTVQTLAAVVGQQSGSAATSAPDVDQTPAPSPERAANSFNVLMGSQAEPSAFSSYHIEVEMITPNWDKNISQVTSTPHTLDADVQGKDIHLLFNTSGDPSGEQEGYVIGEDGYLVKPGGTIEQDYLVIPMEWATWSLDLLSPFSVATAGSQSAGTEVLDGRGAEVYDVDSAKAPPGVLEMFKGFMPTPVSHAWGRVWVDQATGALLKAEIEYEAEFTAEGNGNLLGKGSGRVELQVTRIDNVEVRLPD
jgi:hypothetical protein